MNIKSLSSMRHAYFKIISLVTLVFFLSFCNSPADEAANNDLQVGISEKSDTCEITCPHCGHKKIEVLPTEVCQIKYTCEKCLMVLTPKDGDCCVFCTYGSHKCPSMQEDE